MICLFSSLVFAHEEFFYPGGPLEIIKIGHPTLRLTAKDIDLNKLDDLEYQEFLDDMIDTMREGGGVGLAAPQVNVSERVFVMKPSLVKKAEVIINPKIEYLKEKGMKRSKEGCLSIPGKSFVVRRYRRIHLNYFNREGEFMAEMLSGFRSIVAQHEYDHLNGDLISDWLGKSVHSHFQDEFSVEEIDYDPSIPQM